MRALLVEDDEKVASFILQGLREEGFAVDHAAEGEQGLRLALTEPYDVAIVDLMLPGLDGLSLIETMRGQGVNTPVLILSARRTVDDRVKGLRAGGDDYLVKPFAFAELAARVQALIRRARGAADPTILSCADLSMNFGREGRKKVERLCSIQAKADLMEEVYFRAIEERKKPLEPSSLQRGLNRLVKKTVLGNSPGYVMRCGGEVMEG